MTLSDGSPRHGARPDGARRATRASRSARRARGAGTRPGERALQPARALRDPAHSATGLFGPTLGSLRFSQDAMVIVGWNVGPGGLLDMREDPGAPATACNASTSSSTHCARASSKRSRSRRPGPWPPGGAQGRARGGRVRERVLRLSKDRFAKGVAIQLRGPRRRAHERASRGPRGRGDRRLQRRPVGAPAGDRRSPRTVRRPRGAGRAHGRRVLDGARRGASPRTSRRRPSRRSRPRRPPPQRSAPRGGWSSTCPPRSSSRALATPSSGSHASRSTTRRTRPSAASSRSSRRSTRSSARSRTGARRRPRRRAT